MRILVSSGFAFLLSFIACVPASAGLEQELSGAFNGMLSNATAYGEYVGQRRGVMTGGAVAIRTSMVTPKLISFIPPSVNAGCNGIDLFGGSFSFINTAQFTQLGRNIAQAAVGYAFQLAIEGMCPTCAQVMTKLGLDVTKMNGLMRNSCEFAKGLVDKTGLRSWAEEEKHKAASLNTEQGFIDDFFSSKELSTDSPAKQTLQQNIPEVTAKITGNIVFESLMASNTMGWYVNGDRQMLETLMSLTGTVVINPMPDGSDTQIDFRPGLLKVKDFLQGGDITIYKCESDRCLLPAATDNTQVITIEGMREKARTMLFGHSTVFGNQGIFGKMYSRAIAGGGSGAAIDNNEAQFIRSTMPGIYGLMKDLGTEPIAAKFYGDQMIDIVATETVNVMVDEMFESVVKAVKGTGKTMDTHMVDVMHDVRDQISESRRVNADNVASIEELVLVHRGMKESLKANRFNKQR